MYQLSVAGKQIAEHHDYMFEDFTTFYQIANVLTVPLVGRYSIGIKSDSLQDIKDFIAIESNYANLLIYIYVSEALLDFIVMRDSNVIVAEKLSPYTTFKELITQRSLLFENVRLISLLYSSIEHDYTTMADTVDNLADAFGTQTKITESMLSSKFVLNRAMYPRQVLLAYLQRDRWRRKKLEECLSEMGNDIMLGAFVKNIKSLIDAKTKYYQTGVANALIKSLNASNLLLMYKVFVVERMGLNDITILLNLYERRLSSYDIVQERKNQVY